MDTKISQIAINNLTCKRRYLEYTFNVFSEVFLESLYPLSHIVFSVQQLGVFITVNGNTIKRNRDLHRLSLIHI